MITITSKSPYAVRALTELARLGALPGGQPVPIAELSRRRDIPLQFLEQLFATLRRAGLLQSQRGVKGGYTFLKDPSSVTVLEVVELLDGEVGAEPGSEPDGPHDVWAAAVASLREVLGGTTIADVLQQEAEAAGTSMYHI